MDPLHVILVVFAQCIRAIPTTQTDRLSDTCIQMYICDYGFVCTEGPCLKRVCLGGTMNQR